MVESDRLEWLRSRQKGIGSSDVAGILGMSPWETAIDVYLSKTQPITAAVAKMKPALEWGMRKEPAIAAAIRDHYGWHLERSRLYTHPKYEFLIANPDREIWNEHNARFSRSRECCEIKTSAWAADWGEVDTAEIPTNYWLQTQHQMAVCDFDTCWVFVLIGSSDFRRYRVDRDPGYLDMVIGPLQDFWAMVQAKTPPEPDWQHPAVLDSIKALYQPKADEVIDLPADADILVSEYIKTGGEIQSLELHRESMKARLIERMKGAAVGRLPSGKEIRYTTRSKAGYEVKPTTYADFRIKNAPK